MIVADVTGILYVLLILAFIGFALWKRSWVRIILSICIIVWGIAAMSDDVKIAAPIIGLGTLLFISGIMNAIKGGHKEETEQ